MNEAINPDPEQVQNMKKWTKHDCRKYISLVSSLLVNLMVGSYFSYSRINPYIAAYLRQYDANITNKETLLVLPLWLIVKGIGALLGVKLAEGIGYRTTNAFAFISFTAVTFMTSMLSDYWSFMFIYGIGSGIFIGMGYLPSIYVAWTYFPKRKPLVTGAALFMVGISASILSPLSIKVLNPNNVNDFETDAEIINNVPKLFRVYTMIFGGLTLVGCSLQPAPNDQYNNEKNPAEGLLQQPLAPGLSPQDKKEIEFINYLERDRVLQEFKTVVTEQDALLWNAMKTDRMSGLIKHDRAVREYNSDKFKRSLTIQIGSRQSRSKAGKTGSTVAITTQEIENPAASMPILAHADVTSADPLGGHIGPPNMNMMGATLRFAEFHNDQPAIPNYEQLVLQEIIRVESSCPSVNAALRSKHFWILVIMSYFLSTYSYLLTSVWVEYYKDKMNVGEEEKSFILSFGTLANACSRLLSGFLLLKVKFKTIFFLIAIIVVISASTIDIVVSNFLTGTLYLVAAFTCIGAEVVLFPTACTEVFGAVVGPQVYPYIYITFSISNLTQYFVLISLSKYNEMLLLVGGMAIIGAIAGLFLNSKPKWE